MRRRLARPRGATPDASRASRSDLRASLGTDHASAASRRRTRRSPATQVLASCMGAKPREPRSRRKSAESLSNQATRCARGMTIDRVQPVGGGGERRRRGRSRSGRASRPRIHACCMRLLRRADPGSFPVHRSTDRHPRCRPRPPAPARHPLSRLPRREMTRPQRLLRLRYRLVSLWRREPRSHHHRLRHRRLRRHRLRRRRRARSENRRSERASRAGYAGPRPRSQKEFTRRRSDFAMGHRGPSLDGPFIGVESFRTLKRRHGPRKPGGHTPQEVLR